jgi:hypothetical protein
MFREILDQLGNYQLFKEDTVQWNSYKISVVKRIFVIVYWTDPASFDGRLVEDRLLGEVLTTWLFRGPVKDTRSSSWQSDVLLPVTKEGLHKWKCDQCSDYIIPLISGQGCLWAGERRLAATLGQQITRRRSEGHLKCWRFSGKVYETVERWRQGNAANSFAQNGSRLVFYLETQRLKIHKMIILPVLCVENNTDWGCLRTGCWGEYLDLRGIKWPEVGKII